MSAEIEFQAIEDGFESIKQLAILIDEQETDADYGLEMGNVIREHVDRHGVVPN